MAKHLWIALALSVASPILGSAWIVFAHHLHIETFTRAWVAGSIAGTMITFSSLAFYRAISRPHPLAERDKANG